MTKTIEAPLIPMGTRVLVILDEEEIVDVSEGGIQLPEGTIEKHPHIWGTVVSVSEDKDITLVNGDRVIIRRGDGVIVDVADKTYLLIHEAAIMAKGRDE